MEKFFCSFCFSFRPSLSPTPSPSPLSCWYCLWFNFHLLCTLFLPSPPPLHLNSSEPRRPPFHLSPKSPFQNSVPFFFWFFRSTKPPPHFPLPYSTLTLQIFRQGSEDFLCFLAPPQILTSEVRFFPFTSSTPLFYIRTLSLFPFSLPSKTLLPNVLSFKLTCQTCTLPVRSAVSHSFFLINL